MKSDKPNPCVCENPENALYCGNVCAECDKGSDEQHGDFALALIESRAEVKRLRDELGRVRIRVAAEEMLNALEGSPRWTPKARGGDE